MLCVVVVRLLVKVYCWVMVKVILAVVVGVGEGVQVMGEPLESGRKV